MEGTRVLEDTEVQVLAFYYTKYLSSNEGNTELGGYIY